MIRSILLSIVTKLGASFIGLLVLLISSRYLGVSSRGEISLLVFNITILQIMTESLTGYHLIHLTRKGLSRKLFTTGLLFILLLSFTGNLLLWQAGKLVPGYEIASLLLTILVLLNTFHCVLVLCAGKLAWFNKLSLLQPLLFLVFLLSALFIFHDFRFSAYIYPLIISFALASLVSGYCLGTLLQSTVPHKELSLKTIFKNGFANQTALLLFVCSYRINYYFFEPGAELGLYALVCQLAESALIPVSALMPVYFTQGMGTKQHPYAAEKIGHFLLLSLLLSSCVLCLLALVPESLYLRLLGSGFSGIKQLLLLYAPLIPLMAIYHVLAGYYAGQGKSFFLVKNNLIGCLLSLSLSAALVSKWHYTGAILLSAVSLAIISVGLLVAFVRNHTIPFRKLLHPLDILKEIRREL